MSRFINLVVISLFGIIVQPSWGADIGATEMEDVHPAVDTHEVEAGDGSSSNQPMNYQVRSLAFVQGQKPILSAQNPDNDFLKLHRYTAEFQVRPDVQLDTARFKGTLKPRFRADYQVFRDGTQDGIESHDSEAYINEGFLQVKLYAQLFASAGRENLQWGPSYLRTPSNPFFTDNGRVNPKTEVPGKDFIKLTSLLSDSVTFTLISNTGRGREKPATRNVFYPTHALKFDLVGEDYSLGSILSRREDGRLKLGGYMQKTVSEASLLYFDGVLSRGTDTLYPYLDSTHPLGGSFAGQYSDSTHIYSTSILGGSYTLEYGATLTSEYLYQDAGYTHAQAQQYYQLRDRAAAQYNGPLAALSRENLAMALDTRSLLLRRRYIMLQYVQTEIKSVLNLTFRWTQNLDDHSSTLNSIVDWSLNDHLQLFAIGLVNLGEQKTEFGSISRWSFMLGVEYSL